MLQHVAQSFDNVLAQARRGLHSIRGGIKTRADEHEGTSGDEEGYGINQQQHRKRNYDDEQPTQQWAAHFCGRIACLQAPIGHHEVFLTHQVRDRSKIRGIKADGKGGVEKGHGVNPPDRKEPQNRSEWNRGNHKCPSKVCHHHHSFAVHAINPGANDQTEEEVRKHNGHDC